MAALHSKTLYNFFSLLLILYCSNLANIRPIHTLHVVSIDLGFGGGITAAFFLRRDFREDRKRPFNARKPDRDGIGEFDCCDPR